MSVDSKSNHVRIGFQNYEIHKNKGEINTIKRKMKNNQPRM